MLFSKSKSLVLPTAAEALPGRDTVMEIPETHAVTGNPLRPPFPDGLERAIFGLGCFWGAERKFWQQEGVWTTAAGYAGGFTPNPTYDEVCSGQTGHAEVVLVVYDPAIISYETLLGIFWNSHNPGQGMRQGNDVGTQYRSCILACTAKQKEQAEKSRDVFAEQIARSASRISITTEIQEAPEFYYAEAGHQQYLHHNPHGYCGLAGIGITFAGLSGAA